MPTPPTRCQRITRRDVLRSGAALVFTLGHVGSTVRGADAPMEPIGGRGTQPWPVSLNTSTIRGHKLPIEQTITLAAQAGYAGIEPWPNEIQDYLDGGGTLAELKVRLDDAGLKLTGAIAFFDWMSSDAERRARAMTEAERQMERLAALGGTHIAAPPSGADASTDLLWAGEAYHALLELGDRTGVVPALEIWGFAPVCKRLGEAAMIALEAQHPDACILPDVFHLHKGGSDLGSVRKLGAAILGGFHINDYSKEIPRAQISDRDRVYPGDGDAPLVQLFRDLQAIGYTGPVSVELFNPAYYARPVEEVLSTALAKTRVLMHEALGDRA